MGHTVVNAPEKCVGCRSCEMICSLNNKGLCSAEKSNIRVFFDMFTAKVEIQISNCIGCKQCLSYCPEGVLRFVEG